MSVTSLWTASPDQLRDKHIQQVIAFAGLGKLADGSEASTEFREYLGLIPSGILARYADECLSERFEGSGFALQDVVNEAGRRLGFQVQDGRYRGTAAKIGFDGLWTSPARHHIVVEVKTTDAYRIDLNTLADYRRALIKSAAIAEDASSILIVVGRQDTGDLEAQIRGSRHAWDIRLISVDAVLRLLKLREEVEDPGIAQRIAEVLIPYEYTRVDRIIDLVFSTAEEVLQEEESSDAEEAQAQGGERKRKFTPVRFHDACVARIEKSLSRTLLKRSRATFESADKSLRLICSVSKEHDPTTAPSYWFAFHPYQRDFLAGVPDSYIAFGCGSPEIVLLVPFKDFDAWVDGMHTTQVDDRFYWHVVIYRDGDKFVLHRRKGESRVDLSDYLLAGASIAKAARLR